MAENLTYLQGELEHKIPQKILHLLYAGQILPEEKILAVFGNAGIAGITRSRDCIVSTEDRLVYLNCQASFVPKTIVILYCDLVDVLLEEENGSFYIHCIKNDEKNVKIDIDAAEPQVRRFFDFVHAYKDSGAAYIRNRLAGEPEYLIILDSLRQKGSMKIAKIDLWAAREHEKNAQLVRGIEQKREALANQRRQEALQRGALLYLDGDNGQIELYENRVVITRRGFGASILEGFTKGSKEIYLRQIAAIQLKMSDFTPGYIQFTLPGGIENTGGVYAAGFDENSVTFFENENEAAKAIKAKIEELMNTPAPTQNTASTADELLKFKQLLDAGVLTQEEFEAQKKRLLG